VCSMAQTMPSFVPLAETDGVLPGYSKLAAVLKTGEAESLA